MDRPALLIPRRTILKGAVGAVGIAALAACTGTAGPEGGQAGADGRPTIRFQGGDFGLPNPFNYFAPPGYWKMILLFDTLLWPDASGDNLPWLASSYEQSDDGLVHTVELREVNWHDGTPLTARDVVFTFEYFDANILSPLAIAAPRSVAAITETGDRGVEIRLEHPDVNFEKAVLASVPIMPEHVWADIADPQAALGEETFIGTGPYRLVDRDPAQGRMAFEANDDFFLGQPYVKRIETIQVDYQPQSVASGQLDGGQADVEGVRDELIDPFREDPEFGVLEQETSFAFPMYWNATKGGALADLRFRRAFLMAIDREDIVDRLLTGNGVAGNPGFLPPGHPYHVDVEQYAYDPEAANDLLDESGYTRGPDGMRQNPDGTPLQLTLSTFNTIPPALPELVAANLEDVGIALEQEIVDLVRLFGMKTQSDFDIIMYLYPGPVGTTPNGDPDILRPVFHSDPPNRLYAAEGYENPELDELLDQQYKMLDETERKEVVAEIQRIVARDLPMCILYYTTMFFVYRKDVFDAWYYTPGGFGPGVPDAYNKHAFVTGRRTGLEIRQPGEELSRAGASKRLN